MGKIDEILMTRIEQFWSNRPCNIRHATTSLEEDPLAFSEQVTRRKFIVEPHIWTFSDFDRWKGKRVLDLGCGIGTQSLMFGHYGAQVTAIDISAASLLVAGQRLLAEEEHGCLANKAGGVVHFVQGDMEHLGELLRPGPRFDLIYSFGALHHTPNPLRVLVHACEVAAPGAELRIMLYHRYSIKALRLVMGYGKGQFWRWKDVIREHSEAQEGCPYTTTWTRASARHLVESAGWRVTKMWVDHIFPYRIPEYIRHEYKKEFLWRALPYPLFRLLERSFGWHLLIRAVPA